MGGKVGKCGGFNDKELARRAGAIGGRIGGKKSKKGWKVISEDEHSITYKNKEGEVMRVAKDAR